LTLQRRGDEAQVHYGPRTWPVRGNAEIVAVIESRRATCKYIHDQALRQANKGYTPLKAAEMIKLPGELGRNWHNTATTARCTTTCARSAPRNWARGTATRFRRTRTLRPNQPSATST
jgi:alkyl sulfatase BDS1-like metallo-beta-lactamase superfamily hydrolase